jgi:hypothetical protein
MHQGFLTQSCCLSLSGQRAGRDTHTLARGIGVVDVVGAIGQRTSLPSIHTQSGLSRPLGETVAV